MLGIIRTKHDLALCVAFERVQKRAHQAVKRAVQRGVLTRTWVCFECDGVSADTRYHHDSYARPLDVVELCPPCHAKRHFALGWGAPGLPDGWQHEPTVMALGLERETR